MVLMRIKKRLKRESEEQETSRSISRENEISPVRRMNEALDCECACWRLAIREGHSAREVRVSRADWRSKQASVPPSNAEQMPTAMCEDSHEVVAQDMMQCRPGRRDMNLDPGDPVINGVVAKRMRHSSQ
jgi:phage terminase large subunit GpA-like protein